MDTQPQRRDSEQTKDDTANELKALVVLVYGAMGAGIAANPIVDAKNSPFPITMVPDLELPAGVLMGAVLALAIMLSLKGRRSASWAVIAYGALSVGFVKLFATVLCYSYDVLWENWFGVAVAFILVAALVLWGLRNAMRGKWVSMLGASLLMLLGMVFIGVQLNYVLFFYSGRHPNAKVQSATPVAGRRTGP